MAEGRSFRKELREALEAAGIEHHTCYRFLILHQVADDEGYITAKEAFIYITEDDLEILKGPEAFVERKGSLIKILNWTRWQKLPASKFNQSYLKKYWKGENKDDGLPKNIMQAGGFEEWQRRKDAENEQKFGKK